MLRHTKRKRLLRKVKERLDVARRVVPTFIIQYKYVVMTSVQRQNKQSCSQTLRHKKRKLLLMKVKDVEVT
jgi:predicted lipid carrier protein YhbT